MSEDHSGKRGFGFTLVAVPYWMPLALLALASGGVYVASRRWRRRDGVRAGDGATSSQT